MAASMRSCSKCGSLNRFDHQYCPSCGSPMQAQTTSVVPVATSQPATPPPDIQAQAYLQRAEATADQNKALDLFTQAIDMLTKEGVTTGSTLRDAYYGRGRIYHRRGKYADASHDFDSATDADTRFADGYAMLAWSQFEQGIGRAEKHEEIDTDNFFGKLGAIWNGINMVGNVISMETCLQQAFALEPRNAIALLVEGKRCLSGNTTLEDAKKSLNYFQKAASSDPSLREARDGIAQAEQIIRRKKWFF